ncbi:hypothetical protein KVR01_007431 [Diaporthe batatas]|uniref:uncharacterized protein n=1 Tax=Diaporthe batatas TaxID=748121 RepID=UPI001D049DCE|nr:uncharacterized protein KVR01_007431 [Diaporthe batatas]KAG8162953.1 hypothetical protein KVR01_007431 [Diaporthe batatas]
MDSEACTASSVDARSPTSPPFKNQLDHGEFVDSEDEGEVEFASEDQGLYASGHFYPICIGETLHNGRYRIDHKLGRGGFSVVWLARDLREHKNVALKVLSSSDAAAQEHQIHRKLLDRAQDHSRLVLCQDFFMLQGSKGEHHVLVLPLRGPNLSSYLMKSKRPIAVYMSAAKDLLQAVISLHSAGFVHRDNDGRALTQRTLADIILANTVWDIDPEFHNLTVDDQYKLLGRPRKARMWVETSKPGELVEPATFPASLVGSHAHLCDFGILVDSGTAVPVKLQSPPEFCAPELFHGFEPSFSSDIWSYMVVFMYLYSGGFHPLFPGLYPAHKMQSIIERLGPLPAHWKGRWDAPEYGQPIEGSWYDQDREMQPTNTFSAFLDQHRPDISAVEKACALSLIAKVFCHLPEDRLTASQLADDPDFKRLMQFYEV